MTRRPTVGDMVRLLPGGALNTNASPPLEDGGIYEILQDVEGIAPYRLSDCGHGWVLEREVELIDKDTQQGGVSDENRSRMIDIASTLLTELCEIGLEPNGSTGDDANRIRLAKEDCLRIIKLIDGSE